MGKYIDEYLIALGYDLNDENAKKFLKIQDEIEKRNKELGVSDKSALKQEKENSEAQKKRIKDTKDEIDSTEKLRKANDKLNESRKNSEKTPETAPSGGNPPPPKKPPAAPPGEPSQPPEHRRKRRQEAAPHQVKQTSAKAASQKREVPPKGQKTTQERSKDSEGTDTDKKLKQLNNLNNLKKAFSDLERSWASAKNGNFVSALLQGASGTKHFNSYMNNLGGSFNKTNKQAGDFKKTLSGIFGDKAASSAAEGASDAIEGTGEAAGISGLGVIGAAAGVTAGVALMAKAIWGMSNGFANANTNIETMARELWITDSAAYGLNSTLSAMGKTTADLNEIALNPTLNKQFKEVQEHTSKYNTKKEAQAAADWARDVQTPGYELKADLGQVGATIQANMAEKTKGFFGWLFGSLDEGVDSLLGTLGGKESDASAYAPQSSYYNSNYAEGAKITVAPNINVTSKSDDAPSVGQAAADGVSQSMNNSALIRNTRGLNR